eukprot:17390_1
MTHKTTTQLLQLGKIGTRVQILRDSGELMPDQLFFKSLQDKKLSWSDQRKSIIISPYVLILPGKTTGLLCSAPSVHHIPHSLCLGIVSKNIVLELIFQNSRDRNIWGKGLSLLVSSACSKMTKLPSTNDLSTQYYLTQTNTNIITNIERELCEKQNIFQFYNFLSLSARGDIFYQYAKSIAKPARKILMKLDTNGDILYGIDEYHNIVFKMIFDAQIVIIDVNNNNNKQTQIINGECTINNKIHMFSIIRKEQSFHIGCENKEQYLNWRYGLEYLCDKQNYFVRKKLRKAILNGDLETSQDRKERSKNNYGFWGTLFN